MIGETISHYEILEKLGEGGMGVVYKARDTKLDRFVAVKFLPPRLGGDAEAARRFVHEAKAASALNHPNVGTIYEIDETSDGMTFIVMAYYEAESLRSLIDRGSVGVDQALDIACQMASGLARAHEKGIVHRDIKPSNILITKDGRAEIIDFGLAKLAGSTRLTIEGSTLGTAAYMSPEQARGEEVDHRSDIFSLGVILCEMLAGSPPFKGEHEAALLYEIVHEQPEPISTCRGDLPEGLQDVVDRALAKDAPDRYQSALELAEDLDGFRERSAITSFHAGRKRSVRGTGGKLRITAVMAMIVIVAAVSVFVISRFRVPAWDEETLLAVVDFTDLADSGDHTFSAGLTGLVHTGLVESSPCRIVSPTYLQDIRRRLFGKKRGPIEDSEALEVARESGASMLLSGQIMPGENAYVAWHLVDVRKGQSLAAQKMPGEELTELADRIVENVLPLLNEQCGVEISEPPRSVTELTTANPQAYRHYIAGLLAREEGHSQEELEHLQRAITIDTTFAKAYYELSRHYSREIGLARVYADKAWEHRSSLGTKDLMLVEAWRYWIDYRIQDALDTHRKLLARWPDDRDVLESFMLKLYGNWYAPEALRIAERGMELYPDDIVFSQIHWLSLALDSRLDQALEAVKGQALQHPLNPGALGDLGLMYLWMCLPDSAAAVFNRALRMDPENWWSEQGLGASRYFRGDITGAIEAYERLLERNDLTDHNRLSIINQTVNIYPGLCVLYAEAGRFMEAFAVIEVSRRYASDPESELRYITTTVNFLLLRTGKAEEVLRWARETKDSEMRIARLQAIRTEALALVALDSLEAAQTVVEELRATEPYWGGFASYMALKIGASAALSEGDPERALVILQKIQSDHGIPLGSLHGIEYMEILARAHQMAGRPEEAVAVHRELLRLYGGHALSYYELGKLYEEMGRSADAQREYERFLEMWSQADEGLPQLGDARMRLASLTSG